MAGKASGIGDHLYVDGVDLSGDIGAVTKIGIPSGLFEDTGLDKSAHERMYGLVDGEIAFTAFFNKAMGQEHLTLANKGAGADRVVSYFKGGAIGNMAACLVAKQTTYDAQRPADGSLTLPVQFMGNGHAGDYCEQLTAGQRTDGAATNGASLDAGAATTHGLVAYLQVFAFTGTSAVAKFQESSDDGVGDPFADVVGGAFVAATAVGAQRIATSLTLAVERYLRVKTTGVFSNFVFAVAATRYPNAS